MSLFTKAVRGRGAVSALARNYASVSDAAGVRVAGIENGAPAGTQNLTVVVKAGSRYETKPGVAHVLKNFAFKSTQSGSALKTVREAELYGGVLTAALSREHLFLTAEFLRGDEAHFLSLIASVLSSTHYYPHEYAELIVPTIESESTAALSDPTSLALDIVHNLAFRRGLGYSLYASPHTPISAEDVKSYAQQAYAKSNIAVLGGGISTEALSKSVQAAFGSGSASGAPTLQTVSSQYYGGEQRLPLDTHVNPFAQPTVVIGFGTTSSATPELKVLANLLGGKTSVKWGTGTSPLAQVVEKVPGAAVEAKVHSYSDASLFTISITAPTSQSITQLAKDVVAAVKNVSGVKADEVKKAIAKTKVLEATKFETAEGLLSIAAPALFSGELPAADSSFAALDKVSASSLDKAINALLKVKPSVAAIGDLKVLPYADELGL